MVVGVSTVALTNEEIEALHATIHRLSEKVASLTEQNRLLAEKVHQLTARRFGASSERLHPGQGALFSNEGEAAKSEGDEESETILVPAHRRKKRRHDHGRTEFPEHLPRKQITIDPPETDRECACCGNELVCIRREITERGDVIPTQIVVNQYDRGVWACPCGDSAPKIADLPPTVVDKSKWEPSAYAYLAVSKYADHLPLHRMMGIFRRHGIHFSKSTMWDLLRAVGIEVALILAQMRRELLEVRLIQADETPIQVMVPGASGSKKERKAQTGYMWVYGAFDEGKILFDFTTNRSRAGPREFLGEWSGTLIVDEYAGYDEVCNSNKITRGGCWSHARRKVHDALQAGSKDALEALTLINRLFRLEQAFARHWERRARRRLERGAEPMDVEQRAEVRLAGRRRWSRPVVLELVKLYRRWKKDPRVLPKSLLGKAVAYLLPEGSKKTAKTWRRFTLFLRDGRVPLHNNAAENGIRPVAVGRKNWLVAGSVVGGDTGATIYSLMASCKAIDVNPEEYLCDVLSRLHVETDVRKLTPWGWKAERERRAAESSREVAVIVTSTS